MAPNNSANAKFSIDTLTGVYAAGWVYAESVALENIEVWEGSERIASASINVLRLDVERVHGSAARNSGFHIRYRPKRKGTSQLEFRARTKQGIEVILMNSTVQVPDVTAPLDLTDYMPLYGRVGEWKNGRNVREGYQRGGGLKFRHTADHVEADPDFQDAVNDVMGRCLVEEIRLKNLFLIFKFFLPKIPGDIIEFGSYRGGSAMFMARLAKRFKPGAMVYALDTFAGMPESDESVDTHRLGCFGNVDLREIEATRTLLGLDNLTFVEGMFQDTAPALVAGKRFALAHIDCDNHGPVAFSYETVRSNMSPGGYLVFDDATEASCIGATSAVEELVIRRDGLFSEQIFPHFVFRAPVTTSSA